MARIVWGVGFLVSVLLIFIFRFLIPIVFYTNEGGWVRQNTAVVGSYFIG